MATCCLMAGLLFAANASAQSYYRWVDNEGKVHFSDRPTSAAERSAAENPPADSPADRLVRSIRRNAGGGARQWADSATRTPARATTATEAIGKRRSTR